MDIRSLTAPQGYTAARPATRPDPQSEGTGAALGSLAADFAATLQQGENTALAAMSVISTLEQESQRIIF